MCPTLVQHSGPRKNFTERAIYYEFIDNSITMKLITVGLKTLYSAFEVRLHAAANSGLGCILS